MSEQPYVSPLIPDWSYLPESNIAEPPAANVDHAAGVDPYRKG